MKKIRLKIKIKDVGSNRSYDVIEYEYLEDHTRAYAIHPLEGGPSRLDIEIRDITNE